MNFLVAYGISFMICSPLGLHSLSDTNQCTKSVPSNGKMNLGEARK